jgi:hypothetical protein
MPDGQHFVMFQFAGSRANAVSEPTVVLNWLEKVRQLVAAGQSDGGINPFCRWSGSHYCEKSRVFPAYYTKQ